MQTKDGWTLTDFTAGYLAMQFNGTREELSVYVSRHELRREEFEKEVIPGSVFYRESKTFVGDYELFPDDNEIVGYKKT